MASTLIRNVVMVCSVAALCAALVGCSSSDDGKAAELEKQLDMAEAARMTAEDQLADLRTQVETLMDRADVSPQDLADLRTQVETLMDRADVSPQDLADLRTQVETLMDRAETAEQALADLPFNAAVVDAMEKIVIWGLNVDVNQESGVLENTSALLRTREAYPDSGSEFAAFSQTHKYGDEIVFAIPWHEEDGELHFFVDSAPVDGSLHDDIGVYTTRRIATAQADRDGITTAYGPIEDHGLGAQWQGFELMKAYDDDGTWTVHLFADIEESDVLAQPYDGEVSGFEDYGREILLNDDRVPGTPAGRDTLYIIIPEDGLQGSLDGVTGTFSCTEFYCTLVNGPEFSGYVPYTDSQAIRFTSADGSQPEIMLDIPQIVTPSAEVPKVNYLTFGSWLYVPEDTTDVQAFDFGVFAGGDDPFVVTNLQGLAGTAEYAGKAAGTYAETLHPQTEPFTADVAFTVDFNSEEELGMVTGEVSNFNLESGKPSPVSALSLPSNWWGTDFPGGRVFGNVSSNGDGNWRGEWGGRFFGNDNADPTAHPTSFAGTFGATDVNHLITGSFGAHKQ